MTFLCDPMQESFAIGRYAYISQKRTGILDQVEDFGPVIFKDLMTPFKLVVVRCLKKFIKQPLKNTAVGQSNSYLTEHFNLQVRMSISICTVHAPRRAFCCQFQSDQNQLA